MLFNSFIYTYLNLQNFLYDFNYKLYILFPVKKGNFYIKILVQFPKNHQLFIEYTPRIQNFLQQI